MEMEGCRVVALFVISGVYAGRFVVRTGGGRTYVHVPADVIKELRSRRVRVTAIVNAEKCVDRVLHGSVITFVVSPVRVGTTYRVNIPVRYAQMISNLADCGSLDLWLAPHTG
jgi:ribosomal protein L14E/L6E/L27E